MQLLGSTGTLAVGWGYLYFLSGPPSFMLGNRGSPLIACLGLSP